MGERGKFWTAPSGRLVHDTGDDGEVVYFERDEASQLNTLRRRVRLEGLLGGTVGKILRRISPRLTRTS